MKSIKSVLLAAALVPLAALAQAARLEDNPNVKCWAVAGASNSMSGQVVEMQMGEEIPAFVAQTQAVIDRARGRLRSTVIKGDDAIEKNVVQAVLAMAKVERGAAADAVGKSLKEQGVGEQEMRAENLWLKQSAAHFSRRYKQLKCL